jgi:hypothetical protein
VAITLKTADGQLPAAKGTLYTMAADGFVKVTVVNTDTVARTVNIYVNPAGTSRRVSSKDQSLGAGERAAFGLHALQSGDLVEGDASAATIVDYKVDVVEAT